MMVEQKQLGLDAQRLSEFYHDNFVSDQVRDFGTLLGGDIRQGMIVADVGGGCGYFARSVQDKFGICALVLDSDPTSVSASRAAGVSAELFDALNPRFRGDEDVISFNLVLHHLVGIDERRTRDMQIKAVEAWRSHCQKIFVNEYIYESHLIDRYSPWLIWTITSSKLLSALAKLVGRFVPSLRANTLGVGVRFRTAEDWKSIFHEAGFAVSGHVQGDDEPVGIARRLLLIRTIRRDSFLLVPRPHAGK